METAADVVSAHAADAGLANVTAQHLPERDTARMRQASRLRAAAARRADELIETHSKALGKAEAAAVEATKARNRLGQAELAAAEKNGAVEITITTTAASDEESFALLEAMGMPFSKEGRTPATNNQN